MLELVCTGPKVIKLFFMLNSAEDEMCPAYKPLVANNCYSFLLNIAEHEHFSTNKYENANYCWHFHTNLQRKIHAQLSMKKVCSSPSAEYLG